MSIQEHIPETIYRIFRFQDVRLVNLHLTILISLYRDSLSGDYTTVGLGLAQRICISLIQKVLDEEAVEDIEDIASGTGEESEEQENGRPGKYLNHLAQWGWLRREYDAESNQYYYTFPLYSQRLVTAFRDIVDSSSEVETKGMMSIYSSFRAYLEDLSNMKKIPDPRFLEIANENADTLQTILLSTEDSMKDYFKALSQVETMLEVQEVMIEQMQDKANRRYGFLMETQSFYQYKNDVRAMITDAYGYIVDRLDKEKDSGGENYENTNNFRQYMRQKERLRIFEQNFVILERRVEQLAKAKSDLVSRASAKMYYWMQSGFAQSMQISELLKKLAKSDNPDHIIGLIRPHLSLSVSNSHIVPGTIYPTRREKKESNPEAVVKPGKIKRSLSRPKYTKEQLMRFIDKNTQNGNFVANEDTIKTDEDMEMLALVVQKTSAGMKKHISITGTANAGNWTYNTFSCAKEDIKC